MDCDNIETPMYQLNSRFKQAIYGETKIPQLFLQTRKNKKILTYNDKKKMKEHKVTSLMIVFIVLGS